MKKLMLLVVIAFAVPACGKKQAAPQNAGDMKKAEPAGDKAADPANPCAGKTEANPCAGKPQ